MLENIHRQTHSLIVSLHILIYVWLLIAFFEHLFIFEIYSAKALEAKQIQAETLVIFSEILTESITVEITRISRKDCGVC